MYTRGNIKIIMTDYIKFEFNFFSKLSFRHVINVTFPFIPNGRKALAEKIL